MSHFIRQDGVSNTCIYVQYELKDRKNVTLMFPIKQALMAPWGAYKQMFKYNDKFELLCLVI